MSEAQTSGTLEIVNPLGLHARAASKANTYGTFKRCQSQDGVFATPGRPELSNPLCQRFQHSRMSPFRGRTLFPGVVAFVGVSQLLREMSALPIAPSHAHLAEVLQMPAARPAAALNKRQGGGNGASARWRFEGLTRNDTTCEIGAWTGRCFEAWF